MLSLLPMYAVPPSNTQLLYDLPSRTLSAALPNYVKSHIILPWFFMYTGGGTIPVSPFGLPATLWVAFANCVAVSCLFLMRYGGSCVNGIFFSQAAHCKMKHTHLSVSASFPSLHDKHLPCFQPFLFRFNTVRGLSTVRIFHFSCATVVAFNFCSP